MDVLTNTHSQCIPPSALDLFRLPPHVKATSSVQFLLNRQTEILAYLEESWLRAEEARGKPWNSAQDAQAFVNYSNEVVHV